MKEELISFETAKLAKEKGLDIKGKSVVNISWSQDVDSNSKVSFEPNCFLNGEIYHEYEYDKEKFKELFKDNSTFYVEVSVPTQSLLQKWLREEHKINILIKIGEFENKFEYFMELKMLHKDLMISSVNPNDLVIKRTEEWFDYEQALEKGLQEALKLIK